MGPCIQVVFAGQFSVFLLVLLFFFLESVCVQNS